MKVARGGGGGEYRTCYKYGANRWESNVTSDVLHVRLMSYINNIVYAHART